MTSQDVSSQNSDFRAVVFDLGGVILESPIHLFLRLEAERGLPVNLIGKVVVEAGTTGAWAKLERGELSMQDFCTAFDAELAAAGAPLSTYELMSELAAATVVRPQMIEAVRGCRRHGLKVGALTNNWSYDSGIDGFAPLREEFDAFIESYKVGMRKPDPRIYQMACDALAVDFKEAIFLDDIGVNLKAARQLGMTTIKVAEPAEAIAELERVLGLKLANAS
jgi:putative hydrolase of the HAD superfamily